MIKLLVFVRKRRHMTREQFKDYWESERFILTALSNTFSI
jgi:hypothetical protein